MADQPSIGFGLLANVQKFIANIRTNLGNVQQNVSVTRSSLIGNRSSTVGNVLTEMRQKSGGVLGLGILKVPFRSAASTNGQQAPGAPAQPVVTGASGQTSIMFG